MNFTYYGHSTVKFELNGVHLIIDPFLTSNPHTETNPLDVRADYVLLTHAHLDHVEDAETIARANDATIIATYELAMYYAAKGLKAFGMNLGGSATFPFGKLTLTQAFHSSSMDIDGVRVYMGMPAGLLIETDGTTVYHAGDTALFSDMKLYGERYEIDLAFLPIGDTYTMGPTDATDAAGWLRAKRVVPIHYDTFPVIRQDAEEFCRNLGERGLYVRPNETKDV